MKFPKKVGGNFILKRVTEITDSTLPEFVGGSLDIDTVTKVSNTSFPKIIGKNLRMISTKSIENSSLPEEVCGSVYLNSLKISENSTFPEKIGGETYLKRGNELVNIEQKNYKKENYMRRRKNNSVSKIVFIIIIVIILFIFVSRLFMKDSSTSEYTKYVVKFSEALEKYADEELPSDFSPVIYDFEEINSILISNGYLEKFGSTDVVVSAEPITLSKENYDVSFYNYKNTTTLENRFELKFRIGNIEYTCNKTSCK